MTKMKTKNIFKIVLPVIVILLGSIYFSCDSPSGPGVDAPGRRDYTWTVDTLNYPYDPMYRMWGSSPTDVWTTSSGDAKNAFSHYDGVKWTSFWVDGMTSVPYSIYGFSANNIYIGTAGGGIWHYYGFSWTNVANLTKDEHSDIVFDNMWGKSPSDIYATGAYSDSSGFYNASVIAHFANNKWEIIDTDGIYGIVEQLFENSADGKIYMQVIKYSNTYDSTFIYEYNQGKFTILYRNIRTIGLQAYISFINNEVYFSLGKMISERVGEKFQTVLKVDNPNFYQRFWGRHSSDIFLEMTDGLAHYNGTDVEYLFHFDKPTTLIFKALLFEKEVFFLVHEYTTSLNLIYHGKLR